MAKCVIVMEEDDLREALNVLNAAGTNLVREDVSCQIAVEQMSRVAGCLKKMSLSRMDMKFIKIQLGEPTAKFLEGKCL